MKTKRILAMLMAMCMLAACSMVVSAEVETPVINYLSEDPALNGGYAPVDVGSTSKFKLTGTAEDAPDLVLPDGTLASVVSVKRTIVGEGEEQTETREATTGQTFIIGKSFTGEAFKFGNNSVGVKYSLAENIPVQKYTLSFWYRTNLHNHANVSFAYAGNGSDALGAKCFAIALPSTDGEWKKFAIVWDATEDVEYFLNEETGENEAWLVNNTSGEKLRKFTGASITLGHLKTAYAFRDSAGNTISNANAYIEFCNPVLTDADVSVAVTSTEIIPFQYRLADGTVDTTNDTYNKDENGGEVTDLYKVLGVVVDYSVAKGSTIVFKSASADLSTVGATQVILAAYNETTAAKSLEAVEIVSATAATGGISCTIPASFAGKTVKAYFWASDGTIKPLAAPATVSVNPAA